MTLDEIPKGQWDQFEMLSDEGWISDWLEYTVGECGKARFRRIPRKIQWDEIKRHVAPLLAEAKEMAAWTLRESNQSRLRHQSPVAMESAQTTASKILELCERLEREVSGEW